jgi:predicted Zn-dependent protease
MKLILLWIFLLCSLTTYAVEIEEIGLPDIEQRSTDLLALKNEREMGELIMQKIQGGNAYVPDAMVNQYLQQLAVRLGSHVPAQDFKLHFFGVQSNELNAFAFFGGHVAFHTGLLLAVETESELAAVLAHETSHITQRHLARMLVNNKQMLPLTFIELLAATAVGAAGAPEAGMHLATAALAGHVQKLINYTREHEKEADRIGIELLVKAGFAPGAMASVFNKMNQNVRYQTRPPEYLMTHPMFGSRIADAEHRAAHFNKRVVVDSLAFHLIRVRLEVSKAGTSQTQIKHLRKKLDSIKFKNNPTAVEYGESLVLMKEGKHSEANAILTSLCQKHPEEWILGLTLVENQQTVKKHDEALKELQRLYTLYPTNQAVILYYADELLMVNKSEAAKELLSSNQSYLNDPIAYELLARANGQLKNLVALHSARAEWHYARGEYKEALQQLDIAMEHASGNATIIESLRARKAAMKKMFERFHKVG